MSKRKSSLTRTVCVMRSRVTRRRLRRSVITARIWVYLLTSLNSVGLTGSPCRPIRPDPPAIAAAQTIARGRPLGKARCRFMQCL
ncbi:hypothetical protein L083_7517 [Actinoplanes sp. N902-109]|nr:hypothetical protein L083_7517 [Actinoplanes sp. N902-109]